MRKTVSDNLCVAYLSDELLQSPFLTYEELENITAQWQRAQTYSRWPDTYIYWFCFYLFHIMFCSNCYMLKPKNLSLYVMLKSRYLPLPNGIQIIPWETLKFSKSKPTCSRLDRKSPICPLLNPIVVMRPRTFSQKSFPVTLQILFVNKLVHTLL